MGTSTTLGLTGRLLLLERRRRQRFSPLNKIYSDVGVWAQQMDVTTGAPFRRATSFSRVEISCADASISSSRRFFSFCAKAIYVERILEPYNGYKTTASLS